MAFDGLNAHWPDRSFVTLRGRESVSRLVYARAKPGQALEAQLAALGLQRVPRPATWGHAPPVRLDAEDRSTLAAIRGDVLWALTTEGAAHGDLLEMVKASAHVDELMSP